MHLGCPQDFGAHFSCATAGYLGRPGSRLSTTDYFCASCTNLIGQTLSRPLNDHGATAGYLGRPGSRLSTTDYFCSSSPDYSIRGYFGQHWPGRRRG